MTNPLTQSTIAHFHEARHAKAGPVPPAAAELMKAHPHPIALQSLTQDSTIAQQHVDRHHGVIHATPAAATKPAVEGHHVPTMQEFLTKSTIANLHQDRHASAAEK